MKIERARALAILRHPAYSSESTIQACQRWAADEVERLEKQVAELRAKLAKLQGDVG